MYVNAPVTFRLSYDKTNFVEIKNQLTGIDWMKEISGLAVENAWQRFHEIYCLLLKILYLKEKLTTQILL